MIIKTRFDLFRLSLRTRRQIDMHELLKDFTRSEWIKELFGRQAVFTHHGIEYTYIPEDPRLTHPLIMGKVGRKLSSIEHTAPEDGYQPYIHEAWKAAAVIVDPEEHEDGQKVSIQSDSEVANPSAIAPRLIKALEANFDWVHYLTSIHPITNTEAFWDFVNRNKGNVTKIRFELEVPNMFGGESEFDREMKALRDKENAQKIVMELQNPDGIDTSSDRIRFTAEKAMKQGTGKVTARAKGKNNTFSSQDKQESVIISSSEDGTGAEPDPIAILNSAEEILGRDKV